MRTDIQTSLQAALKLADVPFSATASTLELLRAFLTSSGVEYSFYENESELLAKFILTTAIDGGLEAAPGAAPVAGPVFKMKALQVVSGGWSVVGDGLTDNNPLAVRGTGGGVSVIDIVVEVLTDCVLTGRVAYLASGGFGTVELRPRNEENRVVLEIQTGQDPNFAVALAFSTTYPPNNIYTIRISGDSVAFYPYTFQGVAHKAGTLAAQPKGMLGPVITQYAGNPADV